MKKVLFLSVTGLLLASSSVVAQCSSCAGSAPSFQSVPYASAPIYGGSYMAPQSYGSYGTPISYSSAPAYSTPAYGQPVYAQPMYSQPVYSNPVMGSGCCGQGVPVSQPVYYGDSYAQPQAIYSAGCGGTVVGEGQIIMGEPVEGGVISNVEGSVVAPVEEQTPAVITTPPVAPAETVTPPAPEENKTPEPATEEKKEGET